MNRWKSLFKYHFLYPKVLHSSKDSCLEHPPIWGAFYKERWGFSMAMFVYRRVFMDS